ncbi:MAG: hypothetical protein ACRDQ9_09475, partial [Pseudonocardiaceae bacterium]
RHRMGVPSDGNKADQHQAVHSDRHAVTSVQTGQLYAFDTYFYAYLWHIHHHGYHDGSSGQPHPGPDREHFGGVSQETALNRLIDEHEMRQVHTAYARLRDNPNSGPTPSKNSGSRRA